MTAFITGVSNVSISIKEYRDKEITAEYVKYMTDIQNIFNIPTASITDAQYDSALNDLKKLRDLAVNGFTTPAGGTQLITQEMASNINLIYKSFQAVGITADSYPDILPATKVQLIQDWKTLTYFNLGQLITDALSKYDALSTLVASNVVVAHDANGNPLTASALVDPLTGASLMGASRSLQSMVELEYVKTGNNVIFDQLTSLESATKNTGNALNLLQQVQQILNLAQTPTGTNFVWPPQDWTLTQVQTASGYIAGVYGQAIQDSLIAGGVVGYGSGNGKVFPTLWEMSHAINTDPTRYQGAYKAFASAFFTQKIAFLIGGPTDLNNLTVKVDALMPQLNTMADALGGRGAANTLANNLSLLWSQWHTIRNDFDGKLGYGTPPWDGSQRTAAWLLDGQDLTVTNPAYTARFGKVQDNLTNAIRAGESLNDTQKEGVRRYMLLFDEFYKSASAVLTKVSQIIEKMAQGISR